MRIDGQSPPYIVELKRPEPLKPDEPVLPLQKTDSPAKPLSQERVVISANMREIERLRQQMEAIPEVRLELVALARQQIQNGSYRADPAEIALKMMGR